MDRVERLRFLAECIEPNIIKEKNGRNRTGIIDEYEQDIAAILWAVDCIEELEATLKKYVPKLTETVRMPNTEWVSDEHNEAVRALRALLDPPSNNNRIAELEAAMRDIIEEYGGSYQPETIALVDDLSELLKVLEEWRFCENRSTQQLWEEVLQAVKRKGR